MNQNKDHKIFNNMPHDFWNHGINPILGYRYLTRLKKRKPRNQEDDEKLKKNVYIYKNNTIMYEELYYKSYTDKELEVIINDNTQLSAFRKRCQQERDRRHQEQNEITSL